MDQTRLHLVHQLAYPVIIIIIHNFEVINLRTSHCATSLVTPLLVGKRRKNGWEIDFE